MKTKSQANAPWCDYCRIAPVDYECQICEGRITNAWKYAQRFVGKNWQKGLKE